MVNVKKHDVMCHGDDNGKLELSISAATPPYFITVGNISFNTHTSNYVVQSLSAGNYHIYIRDHYGCFVTKNVEIVEPPPLLVSYIKQHPSCTGNNDGYVEFTVTGGKEPYSFLWNERLQDSHLFDALSDGKYEIMINDANDCVYGPEKILLTENEADCIEIPDAFTPNGDGINDEWIIQNIEMFPSAYISVFNRWGQQVYMGRGDSKPWNGKFNGKLVPTGSFVYIINIYELNRTYTGTVTVVH